MNGKLNMEKNTALVTGASSGIGLAISLELARYGYPLLMVSNEEVKLSEAVCLVKTKYGVNATALCMDLAETNSAQKLFDYCQENNFKIDILVNNAGIFFFNDVADTPPELMETMIKLHVLTPALLTQLFAQEMIAENRKGYILNIASISSRMMMPGIALYSSTKSFLRGFSRAMRNEVFHRGVSITTLSPGAVATGLYNLSPRYMQAGVRLGVIMSAERLAIKAVRKMFKRKAEYIPGGFINRLFIFLVASMPEFFIRMLKVKVDKLHNK
jgi:short-subunit dehydrogenase